MQDNTDESGARAIVSTEQCPVPTEKRESEGDGHEDRPVRDARTKVAFWIASNRLDSDNHIHIRRHRVDPPSSDSEI